jgi:hypothetical protein
MHYSTNSVKLMIKSIHITIMLVFQIVLSCLNMEAQTARQENLQQQKMAFFNEKLQLTSAESVKFWPVYNDYQNRRDKITRDRNNLLQYYEANKTNMSEKEATELISKYVAYQQEETGLLETYTAKFKEFLPAKKVMRIFLVELEFKKWLLEHLRQNKLQASPRN